MLSDFFARLFGKPPKSGEPSLSAATQAQARYAAMINDLIAEARHCDSADDLIERLSHYNGYVREAAIQRAVELASPALLPALVIRLNDWVVQVRDRAREAVLAILPMLKSDARGMLHLLLDVQRLRRAGRTDHAEWITEFERRCVELLGAVHIVAAIDSDHPRVAAAGLDLARRYGLADPVDLCRRALAHSANPVLARDAMAMLRGLPEHEKATLWRQALRSQDGTVRADALRALLAHPGEDGVTLAQDMLADGNAWVRLVASSFLDRQGINATALYVARLATHTDTRTVRACLAGLAETQGAAYLDLVRSYAHHDHARVQVAAFLAWIQLAPGEKDGIAEAVLHSPFRRVRKLFLVFARKHGAFVESDRVLALMRERGDYGPMLAVVQGDPWATLQTIAIIAIDASGDSDCRQMLTHALVAWQNSAVRAYRLPSEGQRAFLARDAVRQTFVDLLAGQPATLRSLAQELDGLRSTGQSAGK